MGVTLAHTYGAHIPFVHVPLPLAAGEWLGNALPDVVKTQFEGQAQALLYGPELVLVSARRVQVNAAATCAASRGSPSSCACGIVAAASSSRSGTCTPTPTTPILRSRPAAGRSSSLPGVRRWCSGAI